MQELQKLKDKGFVALVGDFKKHRYSHPTTYVMQHKKSKLLYVGSTANLYKRLAQHRRLLRANMHKNPNLQKAYLEDPEYVRKQRNRVWGEKELNHLKMTRSRIWTNPETAERLREHLNSPEHRERLRKASRKPIEINGVLYPSQKDAANALGICHKTLSARLKRERMKKNE